MGRYTYDEFKKIAKQVKAELARKGILLEKKTRLKPRDREKKELLFEMAINRVKRYPPRKVKKGIILPYFYERENR
jgi:predicted SprT family Zn-dependent metalloprotease